MQDSQSGREGVASANRLISRRAIDEGLVTSQQYLQETELSQRSIKGDSSSHIQAEYTSKMSTVLTDDEEEIKWSEKKEASLSDNFTMFSSGKRKFSLLEKSDTLPMKNGVCLANFDIVLQRTGLYSCLTNKVYSLQQSCLAIWDFFPIHSNQHVSAFRIFNFFSLQSMMC